MDLSKYQDAINGFNHINEAGDNFSDLLGTISRSFNEFFEELLHEEIGMVDKILSDLNDESISVEFNIHVEERSANYFATSRMSGFSISGKVYYLHEDPPLNIDELAKKAAGWWTEKFTDPDFLGGDPSPRGLIKMAEAREKVVPPSQEVKNKFNDYLEKEIMKSIQDGYGYVISTNYSPDGILLDACKASGMSETNCPWKTDMIIVPKKGTIKCRNGFNQPWVEI